jgi:hypothetical protein
MIYRWCTFLDYYSVFSPLHAYFSPTHGNEKVLVLEKPPYTMHWHTFTYTCIDTHEQPKQASSLKTAILTLLRYTGKYCEASKCHD